MKQLLYSNEPDVVFGSYDALKEAYREFCAENEIEHREDEMWAWFSGIDYDNYREFESEIELLDKQSGNFLLVGSAGTWRGRMAGGEISSDLMGLISKATNRMDSVTVYLEDGAITISATHHDGRNYWTIYGLNKRAELTMQTWEDELSEQELHEKLSKKYYWKNLLL